MKHAGVIKRWIPLLVAVLFLAGCGGGASQPSAPSSGGNVGSSAPASPGAPGSGAGSQADSGTRPALPFTVSSTGIVDGVIDDAYGARGSQFANGVPTLSLPLSFENAPEGTVCYALVMNDPDAEAVAGYVWVHWLAANITTAGLEENASVQRPGSMVQGQNSWGLAGYGGPTPPSGVHTYIIEVYALDTELELEAGFTEEALRAAMEGHVLAGATLAGSYSG